MNTLTGRSRRRIKLLPSLVVAAALRTSLLAMPGSQELGLEPVYPKLSPERTVVLTEAELAEVLASLPGWQHRDGFLYKIFTTPTFPDAIALISRLSYPIQHLDHHPEIRNIYGKVYVGFTTYDQGKKVTKTDVLAARAVEAAAGGYPLKVADGKNSH